MGLIVFSHQLGGERLREKVVVQRILFGDRVPADRVAIVCPIREVGADFTFARAVVQVGVLDGLCSAHFIDSDVTIGHRAVRKREDQPKRSKQQYSLRPDDEPAELPFRIMRGIDLVADLIGKQQVLCAHRRFSGKSGVGHDASPAYFGLH